MGHARFPDRAATGVVEVRSDLDGLDRGGFWAVVVTFEGTVTCVRFASVTRSPTPPGRAARGRRSGPGSGRRWHSSLDERAYRAGVADIRDRIARRARSTRSTSAACCRHRLPDADPGPVRRARRGQPGAVRRASWTSPTGGACDGWSAPRPSCSCRRDGDRVESRPIKGTALDRGRAAAQGRRRERHDRRPRPQRPAARLPAGQRRGGRAAAPRAASRAGPPRLHGARRLAPGRAVARIARRHHAAGLGVGRTEEFGAAGDRRPRAGRRAGRTAGPSGWVDADAGPRPASRSASARSGPTGTRPAGWLGSAPAPASPGTPTRGRSGGRPS